MIPVEVITVDDSPQQHFSCTLARANACMHADCGKGELLPKSLISSLCMSSAPLAIAS